MSTQETYRKNLSDDHVKDEVFTLKDATQVRNLDDSTCVEVKLEGNGKVETEMNPSRTVEQTIDVIKEEVKKVKNMLKENEELDKELIEARLKLREQLKEIDSLIAEREELEAELEKFKK